MNSNRNYYAKMFVKADSLSSKLCKAFNKLQMDDIAVSKAVKALRKLHENVEDSRFENSKLFFEHLTHLLRLPLSRGSSKDRMCTFDEKVFEVVCQFATSFLQSKSEESEEGNETNKSVKGTIHILRRHLYITKLTLTNYLNWVFFRENITIFIPRQISEYFLRLNQCSLDFV